MSLLHDQSTFLLQVTELICKANELGFHVTGGELYRTPEQQALHVKNGRSATLSSQHVKRLAVDLNFFTTKADGQWKLTTDLEELRPLGRFWESLDPANRWGGQWNSFKDAPHFERRETEGAAPALAPAAAPPAEPSPASTGGTGGVPRGLGLLQSAVGPRRANPRDDVETIQRLLNLAAKQGQFALDAGPLNPDGAFGTKTLGAIQAFRRAVLGEAAPAESIEPRSAALARLCENLPATCDTTLLELAYLRAAQRDVTELAAGVSRTLAARNIDTPLRQAHFLAQIGHESGELRFRAEIASGEAYEGRQDLGNTQPGDGRRFKGRGLIQLTGRANYREYGRALGREAELLEQPELVETDATLCVDVAGWFWAKRGLNALADKDDLTALTRRINGGVNGLADRRRLLTRLKGLLGCA
ncbi:MAG: glycoside hydrolase family 19 protein [Candidatus Delongbacteria bacterium]